MAAATQLLTIPTINVDLNAHDNIPTARAAETASLPTGHRVTNRTEVDSETVEHRVRTYFKDVPQLAEIAWCESRFTHVNPATGTVIRGIVNSVDVGVMQINEYYHGSEAREMGIDLYSLQGNMAYARHLYENEGTRPWGSSQGCWGAKVLATNE